MNDKRFTLKLLGVFLMETLNMPPREIRKTFWHLVSGLAVLIVLWRLPELVGAFK